MAKQWSHNSKRRCPKYGDMICDMISDALSLHLWNYGSHGMRHSLSPPLPIGLRPWPGAIAIVIAPTGPQHDIAGTWRRHVHHGHINEHGSILMYPPTIEIHVWSWCGTLRKYYTNSSGVPGTYHLSRARNAWQLGNLQDRQVNTKTESSENLQ